MIVPRFSHVRLLCFLLLASVSSLPAFSQANATREFHGSDHASTPALRNMPPMAEREGHRDKPLHLLVHQAPGNAPDGALQSQPGPAISVGNVTSFDGLGVGGGYTPNAAPPDTNGAVGATQYVQWVNESFAVYDKATGTKVLGPVAGNTLFQPLGATHPCALNNDGDPIAQYDKAANRWVLSQFSVTSGSSKGYWQCVAVSKTSDATGAWNVYAFNYGNTQFNDYPKMGIWSNGYYETFNIFNNGQTLPVRNCARMTVLPCSPAPQPIKSASS